METNIRLSVIIPNRNRRNTLRRVLAALEEQTLPRDYFEVIVVDDHSTDGTPDMLEEFGKSTPLDFTWLRGQGRGAGAARNMGLAAARGNYVVFLDADTIPKTDVLGLHLQWQVHFGSRVCILGRVSMSEAVRTPEQGRIGDTETRFDHLPIAELEWQDYRAANTSMERSAALAAGGFDETLPAAEDTEFSSRLVRQGMRFIYISDIVAVHHHPLTVEGYFRKGQVYGEAVYRWYRKSPELRKLLVQRYGVLAPEQHWTKKLKYFIRGLVVNRVTAPWIVAAGKSIRHIQLEASHRLYEIVFRYHLRRAFRMNYRSA